MMCRFEELSAEDGEIVRRWLTHEAVKPWVCIDDWDAYFAWVSQNPDYYMFKATADGEMIGVFDLEVAGDRGFICVVIDPARQGKGYGKRLLKQFLRDARQLTRDDLAVIEAGIFPGNIGSERCFTACGFQCCGRGEDGEERYENTF